MLLNDKTHCDFIILTTKISHKTPIWSGGSVPSSLQICVFASDETLIALYILFVDAPESRDILTVSWNRSDASQR